MHLETLKIASLKTQISPLHTFKNHIQVNLLLSIALKYVYTVVLSLSVFPSVFYAPCYLEGSGTVFLVQISCRERSGTVVECLSRDQGVAGLSITSVTALCPLAKHIYPCLVLVQTRKICPGITEKLLTET